ncbi:MAG: hybrid sensor histidine kinase/response regulator [Thermodesulfovibrionales bacterium]
MVEQETGGHRVLVCEDILKTQFEYSPDIIIIVDRDLRIVRINRPPHSGLSSEALVGTDVVLQLPGACREEGQRLIRACFEAGLAGSFEHAVPDDGWRHSRIVPLKHGDVTSYAMIICSDVTERKKAEDALRESEKKLRDITSHMGEALYVLDDEGHISFMNPVAEKLLGWSMQEMAGKNAHDLFHNCHPDGSRLPFEDCPIRKVLDNGRQFVSADEVFVRKDGTVFPVSVIASPITEDGKIAATVTAFRDITDIKRLEQELSRVQKLESVGVLAGGIAHDFNNLLQAILGHISMASMSISSNNQAYGQLRKAEEAIEMARDLSFRLLTFSKGGEPLKQVTSITEMIRQTVTLSLSGANVAAEFSLPDDLHLVEVDEGQIRQVLSNLTLNAKEAMPDGGTLTVQAENVQLHGQEGLPVREGAYLHIVVRDSGRGIEPETLQRIFDPYFSTKKMGAEKGMGLGLSICHSIMKKHGGFITAESVYGKGSVFHLYLPAVSETGGSRPGLKKIAARKKVLFMDDDPRVRYIVIEIIKHFGYDVEIAEKGEEAVELFRKAWMAGSAFDAVILDLTVPGGMGGDVTMKKLREIDPGARGIISSGYADSPVMKDFMDYGFSGAIAKPYKIDELREALHKLLYD